MDEKRWIVEYFKKVIGELIEENNNYMTDGIDEDFFVYKRELRKIIVERDNYSNATFYRYYKVVSPWLDEIDAKKGKKIRLSYIMNENMISEESNKWGKIFDEDNTHSEFEEMISSIEGLKSRIEKLEMTHTKRPWWRIF
ncbi:MAG: hypothetical protein HOI55_11930 [Candidatus Marinimicrobia bacterium]|jgi:hypothetical protein|nr:hypothetical protein [Candidatus Neomarinimicrobiota bacterium]